MATPTFTLNNGYEIPALGFGTFTKEGTASAGVTYHTVLSALKAGYRHLDCAWYYLNEDEVGIALREFMSNNPSVKREDIFITTKVWPHLSEPEDVEWSLNNSLENLGVDYVDCFLIHWPFAVEKTVDHKVKLDHDGKYILKKGLTENLEPTWRALEKLYKAGRARSIGVSNFKIEHLDSLLKYAEIKPAINQIEIHPFLPNTELIEYCHSHGVLAAAYSPLGSQQNAPNSNEKVLDNAELISIAKKKGGTVAQVLIAWGIKRGYVVLPKSATDDRIISNFRLIDLSDEEFEDVNKVAKGRNCRFVNPIDMFGFDSWPEESA